MSVYFLGHQDLVKIGFSEDVRSRFAQIKNGGATRDVSFLGYMPGDRDLEKHLHHKFSAHRAYGEWFRSTPELLAMIDAVCDKQMPSSAKVPPEKRVASIEDFFVETSADLIKAYISVSGQSQDEALQTASERFNVSDGRLSEIISGGATYVTVGEFMLCQALGGAACEIDPKLSRKYLHLVENAA